MIKTFKMDCLSINKQKYCYITIGNFNSHFIFYSITKYLKQICRLDVSKSSFK